MRRTLLAVALSAIYWMIVTPLGRLARLMGRGRIPMAADPSDATYWTAIEMDTADPRLYEAGAAETGSRRSAGEWPAVLAAYRRIAERTAVPWAWWALAAVLPWGWLAAPPRDAQISAELYVLF